MTESHSGERKEKMVGSSLESIEECKNETYSKTFSAVILTYPKQVNNFLDY